MFIHPILTTKICSWSHLIYPATTSPVPVVGLLPITASMGLTSFCNFRSKSPAVGLALHITTLVYLKGVRGCKCSQWAGGATIHDPPPRACPACLADATKRSQEESGRSAGWLIGRKVGRSAIDSWVNMGLLGGSAILAVLQGHQQQSQKLRLLSSSLRRNGDDIHFHKRVCATCLLIINPQIRQRLIYINICDSSLRSWISSLSKGRKKLLLYQFKCC